MLGRCRIWWKSLLKLFMACYSLLHVQQCPVTLLYDRDLEKYMTLKIWQPFKNKIKPKPLKACVLQLILVSEMFINQWIDLNCINCMNRDCSSVIRKHVNGQSSDDLWSALVSLVCSGCWQCWHDSPGNCQSKQYQRARAGPEQGESRD